MRFKFLKALFLWLFTLHFGLCSAGCNQCKGSWYTFDENGPKEMVFDDEIDEIELPIELPDQGDYRLKSGDVLFISIYGEEGTAREVPVDPRGMISYLFVESVPAIGRTIAEVREDLIEKLKSYYRYVVLSVTPVRFGAAYYVISGEVKLPGRKQVVGNPTLLSAIGQAGGMTLLDWRNQLIDASDLDHAFLARRGHYIPVDFVRLVMGGDLSHDVPLMEGDYIYIPDRKVNQVFVVGETRRNTTVEYFHDMSLAEAMSEAGGVTDRASSRVLVIRGSLACPVKFLVDYSKIVKGRTCDFPLLPGDIVYVPPRRLQKLREIFYSALNSFVATVAAVAGERLFLNFYPDANQNEAIIFGPGFIPGLGVPTTGTTTP